jgi:hypothetical protein
LFSGKPSTPSMLSVTITLEEDIYLYEFDFGGLRCYGDDCDKGNVRGTMVQLQLEIQLHQLTPYLIVILTLRHLSH